MIRVSKLNCLYRIWFGNVGGKLELRLTTEYHNLWEEFKSVDVLERYLYF